MLSGVLSVSYAECLVCSVPGMLSVVEGAAMAQARM